MAGMVAALLPGSSGRRCLSTDECLQTQVEAPMALRCRLCQASVWRVFLSFLGGQKGSLDLEVNFSTTLGGCTTSCEL